MLTQSFKKNKGTVLISALFIMTIVAIAAYAMTMQQRIDIRRTELTLNTSRLYYASDGITYWARSTLIANVEAAIANAKNNAESTFKKTNIANIPIIDNLPLEFPLTKEGAVTITGRLSDLQSRFNLNNLRRNSVNHKNTSLLSFIQLLKAIEPSMTDEAAADLTKAISEWISPAIGQQVLEQYYLKLNPPYRQSHRLMVSVSELRLVKGFNASLYHKLLPYISVLPEKTVIDINTATIPILQTLGAGLSVEQAQSIIDFRTQSGPIEDINKFLGDELIKPLNISANEITLSSQYFQVRADIKLANQTMQVYTILKRELNTKNKKPEVTILLRSINAL